MFHLITNKLFFAVPLPIVFLCNVGPPCRLHCCLGNRRFRRLLASILLGDLDLQMVRHVLIRMGHACPHASKVTSLWQLVPKPHHLLGQKPAV